MIEPPTEIELDYMMERAAEGGRDLSHVVPRLVVEVRRLRAECASNTIDRGTGTDRRQAHIEVIEAELERLRARITSYESIRGADPATSDRTLVDAIFKWQKAHAAAVADRDDLRGRINRARVALSPNGEETNR